MPLNLIFIQPGTYTLEDNGIPGDNTSVIKDSSGAVIFTFAHPADALGFTVSTPGVNVVVNLTDSLGTANFTLGNLADPAASPDSITVRNVSTTGTVTLVANEWIREGGSDAAADITAGAVVLSAGTGVGTGANAIETRTGLFEAETGTGGISVGNFGSVQIGGISADVDGLDVATSGNIHFKTLGSIFLSEANSGTAAEVVHGGSAAGNVTLTATGANSDIIGNVDNAAASAARGSITFDAGRDIQLGTIGADFNNDVIASGAVTMGAGRDILVDGFADILSDNFGLNTGGDMTLTAGRNVGILQVAGTSASVTASGSAGADLFVTTGEGGTLTVGGPGSFALGSTSGNVTVLADRVLIDGGSGISAPSGQVSIGQVTPGWEAILGSVADSALALELSDVELDRIFTPTLVVGGASGGPLSVVSSLTPANIQNLMLLSGTDISVGASVTVAQALDLVAGDNLYYWGGTISAAAFTAMVDNAGDDLGLGGFATLGSVGPGTITLSGRADGDTLRGAENVDQTVQGKGGNDTLFSSGEGSYFGEAGDDTVFAGLSSGAVPEVLDGGVGTDTLDTTSYDEAYVIDMATGVTNFSYESFVNFENIRTGNGSDTITGTSAANVIQTGDGDDTLDGGAGDDSLVGGAGQDLLVGGAGQDLLVGGAGQDTLRGGGARDVFQFRDGDMGATRPLADLVSDFSQAAAERISLGAVDANTNVAGNQAFNWIGNGAFTGAARQLHFVQQGGKTFIEGDTNGDGAADFVIALTGTINLVAADFAL